MPKRPPLARTLSVRSSDIHLMAILQELPKPSFTKIRLKIAYVKSHLNHPGANELNSLTQI